MLNIPLSSPITLSIIFIFLLSYLFVILEEFLPLKKSKPVVLASGLIWILVAVQGLYTQQTELVNDALRIYILNFAELFLFLLVAITYINVLEDRLVFESLRSYLISKKLSYHQLFWITGILSFFISSLADNLTTALAMGALVIAVGKDSPRFVILSCINVVVAANAGGAFSPFGDITTLMVWQAQKLSFTEFFPLFLPSVVNYIIPAFCLAFALPNTKPAADPIPVRISRGGKRVICLFLATILTTVIMHHSLHLPPAIGMMMGFAYLQFFSFYTQTKGKKDGINIFPMIQRIEWDTLLFFYGIILCIGGLSTIGVLSKLSTVLYEQWTFGLAQNLKAAPANILIGILSAIVDNIPLMFSVIAMDPAMSKGQWLLITLTAGVGGSLLSIGSAAGIALMGQSNGAYTFMSHFKWSWAIFLGYVGSIVCHFLLNGHLF